MQYTIFALFLIFLSLFFSSLGAIVVPLGAMVEKANKSVCLFGKKREENQPKWLHSMWLINVVRFKNRSFFGLWENILYGCYISRHLFSDGGRKYMCSEIVSQPGLYCASMIISACLLDILHRFLTGLVAVAVYVYIRMCTGFRWQQMWFPHRHMRLYKSNSLLWSGK